MAKHFVLQENPDGTVKLTQQKQVLAEVCGKVTYVNNKNRKIFSIHAEKMDRKFRCVLSYPNPFCPLKEGDAIYGVAEYIQDSRYGDTLNLIQPPFVALGEDKNTIIKGFVTALRGTGFGTMKAHQLVEALVEKTGSLINSINTLDRLSSYFCFKNSNDVSLLTPYSLVIKEKQMLKLLQWWYKQRNMRRLWLLGFNNTEIKSAKLAPEELYQVCLDNPYKIVSLSMDKADVISNRLGLNISPEDRKCAEISRTLNEYMDKNGWTGIPSGILVKMYPNISQYVPRLKELFDIKTELRTAYLPYPYEVETGITELVTDLLDSPTLPHSLSPSEITYTRSDLTDDQKMVIEKALNDNICIIRGGGGTGKTTIIKEIVHNLVENDIQYRVVSFTGKAVARIREVIDKKEPMTMHMHITMASSKKSEFSHLIIDEASMVTSELLYDFTQKFGHNYRITLIGDPNQLTPISWGTMFDQLIKSGIVPTYTLRRCHRVTNGDRSGILTNANHIVECAESDYGGPPFDFDETDDFNILEGGLDVVKELITVLQNNGVPSNKITIISPYNKYLQQINTICQETYNDIKRSVHDERGVLWRIGDRVMMTENNYKINVMNGDEGVVTDLTAGQIQITFKDGENHVFGLDGNNGGDNNNDPENNNIKKQLTTSSLTHSFGVSVHRYQGSECDYVIFYIPESKASKFLNRNLLYTGITRAKKLIWMVGDYDTMLRAATTAPSYRCDNLAQRLQQARTVNL